MPLAETEIDVVVATLCEAHLTCATLRAYVRTFQDVSTVPESANVRAEARALVVHLDQRNPVELESLLVDVGQNNRDVFTIAAKYREARAAPPGAALQPWQDRLLRHRAVFLDRTELRRALANLVSGSHAGAMVVRGPTKTGKTWTAELIKHIATARRDRFAHMASAFSAGVAATVDRILVQLGATPLNMEPVKSPDSHWYNLQCTRILSAAGSAAGALSWIVIDRMGDETTPTTELCDYLLEAVTTSSNSRARLVLLGYPRPAPPDTVSIAAIEWEELNYGGIGPDEISSFFDWLYREVIARPLTQAALTSEVEAVMGGRMPDTAEFLGMAGREMLTRTRSALTNRDPR